MRFHRQTISVEEAVGKLLQQIGPLEPEEVPLAEAYGRVLARSVAAAYDLPPFDRSPLDGYAVRAEDTIGAAPQTPVTLQVVGTIAAGEVPNLVVGKGQACRIMTGAMIPEGANAVVMFEQTEHPGHMGRTVRVKRAMKPGENLSRRGEEVRQGTCVLKEGTTVGAGALALLATFGTAVVPVRRRPRVGIISTGSELIEPDQPLVPGKIRNSNSLMIAGMVRDAGGQPVLFGRMADELEEAKRQLSQWIGQVDLLVTTGGVSVGDFDVIAALVDEPEFHLLFQRVAMRPGSPTTAFVYRDKLVCALSGNPSASYVGCELFVKPVMAKLLGKEAVTPTVTDAVLAEDYLKPCPYPRYLRGRLQVRDAVLYAYPDKNDKAGMLVTLHASNCLIVIPPGGRGKQAGERVRIYPLATSEQMLF
ncbi:MAG: molybdopterin molybdotransferase MoeA [Brevibacillus sp.]|nr:molybdopterin molybdotransferase MoeA [Brevibacillus sp.]